MLPLTTNFTSLSTSTPKCLSVIRVITSGAPPKTLIPQCLSSKRADGFDFRSSYQDEGKSRKVARDNAHGKPLHGSANRKADSGEVIDISAR